MHYKHYGDIDIIYVCNCERKQTVETCKVVVFCLDKPNHTPGLGEKCVKMLRGKLMPFTIVIENFISPMFAEFPQQTIEFSYQVREFDMLK